MTVPELQPYGVKLNTELNALICVSCHIVMPFDQVSTHHPAHASAIRLPVLSLKHRETLAQKYGILLTGYPPLPTTVVPAYEGLPIKTGFRCPSVGCTTVRGTRGSMRGHWKHHNSLGEGDIPPESPGDACLSQQFTQGAGSAKKLFEVLPRTPLVADKDHPLHAVFDIVQEMNENDHSAAENARLAHPLFRNEHWDLHVAQYEPRLVTRLVTNDRAQNVNIKSVVDAFFKLCIEFNALLDKNTRKRLNSHHESDP